MINCEVKLQNWEWNVIRQVVYIDHAIRNVNSI